MNWAYLVRCADGSLYAGWTNDLPRRLAAHNAGTGAKYTRGRRPVSLAWAQAYPTQSAAMAAEARLKKLPKPQKETLAAQMAAQGGLPVLGAGTMPLPQSSGSPAVAQAQPAAKRESEMEQLAAAIAALLKAQPVRMVLSAPRAGAGTTQQYRRATLVPTEKGWQVQRFTATQAFHQNLAEEGLAALLEEELGTNFAQLTAFAPGRRLQIKVSKKGKVLTTSQADDTAPKPKQTTHDRKKNAVLPHGQATLPLVDIGVMTTEGKVVAARRDKYRQVMRFVEIVDDVLQGDVPRPLRVVDFGCGKSSLTFVLYHYLTAVRALPVQMQGLDLKEDVVAACNAAAGKYGYEHLRFSVGDIAAWQADGGVDMVVSLHACDTATDHALANALAWGARWVFAVPCCQHEANAQMKADAALALVARYGLIKERAAALFTDAIRANLLVACGYKTQLVEFVGFEHTPKNILIRAVKTNMPMAQRRRAMQEAEGLCAAFGLAPTLLGLLRESGLLPPKGA